MNLYTLRRPSERRPAMLTATARRRSPALDESKTKSRLARHSPPPAWLHAIALLAALLLLAAIACGFLFVFAEIARRVGELGRGGVPLSPPAADSY